MDGPIIGYASVTQGGKVVGHVAVRRLIVPLGRPRSPWYRRLWLWLGGG